MGISIKTNKMLWGRAASRCTFPDCRRELVLDTSGPDDDSLIGDVCHIVARESNGPRGEPNLTLKQRDEYANLILLCKNHHKLIDDQPNTYTEDSLHEMKSSHEQWVREALGFDPAKQHDDELYASYIEQWAKLADIDGWQEWVTLLLHEQMILSVDRDKYLATLETWLYKRIWPGRYPEVDAAFENFRQVLADLRRVFHRHAREEGDVFWTPRFYKIPEWNRSRYKVLLERYSYHADLVPALAVELTRAANYVCDLVRRHIDSSFRLQEGRIMVKSPYDEDNTYSHTRYRIEYSKEGVPYPYPGLEKFSEERAKLIRPLVKPKLLESLFRHFDMPNEF